MEDLSPIYRWLPLIVSPFVGSLLGLLIVRLPTDQPIGLARSRCDRCHHPLAPRDLIPLVSFAALRGRCRYCESKIGLLPLAAEISAIGVALIAIFVGPIIATVWASCVLGWVLIALAWIDGRTMLLPDKLTLPLVLAGLGATFLLNPTALFDNAVGAAGGYAAFRLLAWTYRRLRGRDGLGLGDAKLLSAGGAWLGWMLLPNVILIAAIIGLCGAITSGLMGRTTPKTRLPFGPYLAASIWCVWLYRCCG